MEGFNREKNNKIDFTFSKQASTKHFINFSTLQRLYIEPIITNHQAQP